MSEHAPDRLWSGIDIPKTIAGVLAALTAAILGSFLGAAGTLAGAAIASVVGSVGTEIYKKLVHRGQKKLVATFVTAPAAVGTPEVAAATDEVPSDEAVEADPPRKIRWGRMAMVAAGVFVLAMGVLTAFEAITGKTAADAVTGHSTGSSTTLGGVLGGGHDKKSDQSPATTPSSNAPSSNAPSEPANGDTRTGAPTTQPTSTDTSTPSAPSTSTAPAAPDPTATDTQNSDSGGGDQNNIAPPATAQPQETE
jgi:hypothetical protein